MKLSLSSAVRALFVSSALVACAVHGADDDKQASSNAAISGSIDTQRSCAAAATYASDGPNDFDTPADAKLPAKVHQAAGDSAVSHFTAPSVGDVYASSLGTPSVTLFDVNGRQLAIGIPAYRNAYGWLNPKNGEPLDCSGTPYTVNPQGSSSSSSGSSSGSTEADSGTPTSSSGSVGTEDGGVSGEGDDDGEIDGGVAIEDGGAQHH